MLPDILVGVSKNFNPRPREGGDRREQADVRRLAISIHAPREGGDSVAAEAASQQ